MSNVFDDGALAVLERQIDEWLAGLRAENPAIEAIDRRLRELILAYRIGEHRNETGVYVCWSEIEARIGEGAFDDLLDRL